MTQPSLSRQLKKLEEEVGSELFVRRSHGIELTTAGAKLAEAVAPVLTALGERLQLIRDEATTTRGTLRIGSLAEIGKSFVMPRLLAFAREYPEVDVDLRLLQGAEIEEAVLARELDFGFVVVRPEGERFVAEEILRERSVVVTRASHGKTLNTTGDVLASAFIAYRRGDPLLDAFLAANFPGLNRRKIVPRFFVNDHRAMTEALLQLNAFAVMPVHSVAGYLETGALHIASTAEYATSVVQIGLAATKKTMLVKVFEDFFRRRT